MSAPLGAFVPKPAQTGEKFQANAALGRPLIVQVVGVDGARQVSGQNGQGTQVKKAVTVHVWDLLGGPIAQDTTTGQIMMGPQNTVYCNVMWMAQAVADQLGEFNGAPPMPIKLIKNKNKGNEYSHIAPVPLEGPELQQVQAFFAQDPTRIDREAAAKAQAAAAQSAAPAYQQTGFTPMQVQPSAPQPTGQMQMNGQTVPTYQQPAGVQYAPGPQPGQVQQLPAPAAAQFQAPPGQQGAIANIPAQVAQQWAPVDQAVQQAMAQQPPQSAFVQAAAPEVAQMPNPVQQAFQQHQAQQFAPQQPPAAAPGQPGFVQNSDVANILQNLAGSQPQQ